MAEQEVEAGWRADIRATDASDSGNVFLGDPKAAFRWSGYEVEAQPRQFDPIHHYIRWTFALAILIVGLISLGQSFLY
jgi:hypothetical protein